MIGPAIMPSPHINPRIENAKALFELSVISPRIDLAIAMFPFNNPLILLDKIAHTNVRENPNKVIVIAFANNPINKRGRLAVIRVYLPYRSDNHPHARLVMNWPSENASDIYPA